MFTDMERAQIIRAHGTGCTISMVTDVETGETIILIFDINMSVCGMYRRVDGKLVSVLDLPLAIPEIKGD